MRKLVKRLLACCLVFALALTMLCGVGAISASAASTFTGTLTVGSQKVDIKKVTTVTVPITLTTDDVVGFDMAQFDVAIPEALQGKLTSIGVTSDNQTNPAALTYKADGKAVSVANGATGTTAPDFAADGSVKFVLAAASAKIAGPKEATVNLTFDLSAYAPGATITELYKDFDIEVKNYAAADNGKATAGDFNIQPIEIAATNGQIVVNYLRLSGASAIFTSDYKLFFYVNKQVCDTFEDVKVKVEKGGVISYIPVEAGMETGTSGGAAAYKFYLPNVSAKNVADPITATVMAGDFEGTSVDYNLVTYATNIITKAGYTQADKDKMAAFLEYASAAQTYFKYNNDAANLADANLPAAYKNKTTVDLKDELAGLNKSLPTYISGASVVAEAQIIMLAYVSNNNVAGAKLRMRYADNKEVIAEENVEYLSPLAEKYGIACDKIAVKDMVRPLEITLLDGSGNELNTITYSFRSYAARSMGKDNETLARKMMCFAKTAAIAASIPVNF